MGKVKRLRQKYHLSLKKSKSSSNSLEVDEEKKGTKLKAEQGTGWNNSGNIFAGVNISLDDLNKTLSKDFDVRSVVSSKSRKELKEEERHLKKNVKKNLRHERFLQKLELTHQLLKASKSKIKNANKYLSVDMSSLKDALPSLYQLEVESSQKRHVGLKGKPKGILKAKLRLKKQTQDVKVFKAILSGKTFKEDPFKAVKQLLQEKS